MHALTCGIPPSSVVEVFSTVINNSGFKSINSISVGYRYIGRFDAKISVIGKSQNSHIGATLAVWMLNQLTTVSYIEFEMLGDHDVKFMDFF